MNRLPRRAIVLAVAALAANSAAAQVKGEPDTLAEAAKHRDGISFHRPGLDVALYGLIDLSLGTRNNVDAAGHRLTTIASDAYFSGPRWGVIGSRRFGNGLPSVIWKLESEYHLDTGNLDAAGTIFNRDAWVGFYSDSWGKLTLGRQNTVARDFAGNWGDPYLKDGQVTYEERGWTNNNNFKQLIFYAASPTGTRWDRGIAWKKQFGQFMIGLGHQFSSGTSAGSDPTPGTNINTSNAVGLAWNGGQFNASGFYNQSDTKGAKHKTLGLGGNAGIGAMVRVYGGVFRYNAEQPLAPSNRTDNAWTLSGRFIPTGSKFDYQVGYAKFKATNAAVSGSGAILTPFKDTSASTTLITGGTGRKGTIYGSIFYHFDPTTEVYLAANRMTTKDGWTDPRAGGIANRTQAEVAVGIRMRF